MGHGTLKNLRELLGQTTRAMSVGVFLLVFGFQNCGEVAYVPPENYSSEQPSDPDSGSQQPSDDTNSVQPTSPVVTPSPTPNPAPGGVTPAPVGTPPSPTPPTTSSPPPQPITVEAENFQTRNTGNIDTRAAGTFWMMTQNGVISTPFSLTAAGTYEVEMAGLTHDLNGIGPRVQLVFGGTLLCTVDFRATSVNSFTCAARVGAPGTYTLEIHFTNDEFLGSGQDRNLLVDKATVRFVQR